MINLLTDNQKSNINNVEHGKRWEGMSCMIPEGYKNAQVVTSDGKKIGIVKSIDSNSLIAIKKGFVRDEEFHIPINAISHYGSKSSKSIKDNHLKLGLLNRLV
jgi:hypothetical protein